MVRKLLTIIIPVRSEEETIRKTIESLEKSVHTSHVIMIADDTVDPGDKTIEVVEKMKMKNLLISKKSSSDVDGFGPALLRASQQLMTPYAVYLMADCSDDPKTIDQMVSVILERPVDVVAGCRYMKDGKKIRGPKLQGALSYALNAFFFHCFRFPTRDSSNAFKMYRTDFLKDILPESPEIGVEFSLQLTIHAVSKNARMIDIPTTWRGREQGQSKVKLFSRGPKYLKLIWRGLTVKIHTLFL